MYGRTPSAFFVALAFALALAACVSDPSVRCPDGALCPSGTSCHAVSGVNHCVTPDQLAACAGQPAGTECELGAGTSGVCNAGACVRPGCNDGILGAGERCDGDQLGGETCRSRGFHGGDLRCTDACAFDVSGCVGECGDGVLSDEEQCDPGNPDLGIAADLGGATCAIGGYYQPQGLRCTDACTFDLSACQGGRCGDNVVDAASDEECDGAAMGASSTCRDLAYYGDEALSCTVACRYDRVACEDQGFCGDGTVNGDEQCEAGVLGGATCQTVGGFYDPAGLRCNSACLYDVSQCTGRCGDDVQNGDEECDGGDLGDSATCDQLGFYGNAPLTCAATCTYDRSACQPGGYCGDGIINGDEQCDGTALAGANCQSAGGYYQPSGLACNSECRFDFTSCQGRCGDGVLNGLEVCDPGLALDAAHDTCGDFGFYNTTTPVTCSGICQYDVTACVGRCGDGTINGTEQCDGAATGGATCADVPPGGWHTSAALACTSGCTLDTQACLGAGRCGDGRKNGPEGCDGGDFGGQSCLTGSLFPDGNPRYGGILQCRNDCSINTAGPIPCVFHCGDGIINGPEVCDVGSSPAASDDIFAGGVTCQGLGYQSGELLCLNQCAQFFNACQERCGDGIVQGTEECDGGEHTIVDGACTQVGEEGALGCSSFCRRETTACESTAWLARSVSTLPFGGDEAVRGLWSNQRHDVWILYGPDNGARDVLRGDGTTWVRETMAPSQATAITGDGADAIWIGDESGAVVTRAGTAWTPLPDTLPGAVRELAHDGTTLFAATTSAVYRFQSTWIAEAVPGGPIEDVAALRATPDGRLVILLRRGSSWWVGARAPAGTWSTEEVMVFGGVTLYDVRAGAGDHLLLAGGSDDTLPFANQDALLIERRDGVWSTQTLMETTSNGPRSIPGAATGLGGDLDDLWVAGFDEQGRGWIASVAEPSGAIDRVSGPYGRFLGLTDSGAGDLWAWGEGRIVGHREGGGWRRRALDTAVFPGPPELAQFSSVAVTTSDVWIAGQVPGGGLARYREALPLDRRWEHAVPGFSAERVLARSADDVWAFGFGNQAQRWNGSTWALSATPFDGSSISATLATGGSIYLADSTQSTVWRHDGATWTAVASWPGNMYAEALAGTGPNDLWVGGSDVYHHTSGTVFDQMVPSGVGRVRAMWAVGPNDVWAAGDNNGTNYLLHRSFPDAGGDRFVALEDPPFMPYPLTAMWGSPSGDVWAVGQRGQMLHYDGQRWTPVRPATGATNDDLVAVHGASAGRVVSVGRGGAVLAMRHALPTMAAPPCADARPLYCGTGMPGTDRVSFGTIPPGGRALYRFEPPYRTAINLIVRTPLATPQPVSGLRVLRADPISKRCDAADVAWSGTDADTELLAPGPGPELILPRHAPVFIELTAGGATTAVGYELELQCANPNF